MARRESVVRKMIIQQRELSQIAVLEDNILIETLHRPRVNLSLINNVYLSRRNCSARCRPPFPLITDEFSRYWAEPRNSHQAPIQPRSRSFTQRRSRLAALAPPATASIPGRSLGPAAPETATSYAIANSRRPGHQQPGDCLTAELATGGNPPSSCFSSMSPLL